jgi:chromosome partitioning protein
MQTITLLNEKGGVGKTTLATHLACGLAARGKRVMLIDTDPQGHATIRMGLPKAPMVYDLLVRNVAFNKTARKINPKQFGFVNEDAEGKLWVVASNIESRTIAASISDALLVYAKLQQLQDLIDVVIFDASPTPSLLHGAIHLASDALLIPTELSYLSLDSLIETKKHLETSAFLRQNKGIGSLEIMGIVPTKTELHTIEHRDNMQSLRNEFGDLVWDPIPKRTIWREAEPYAKPVWGYDPASDAAFDAYNLIDQCEAWLAVQHG